MGAVRGAMCALLVGLAIVPAASARVGSGYGVGLLWPAEGTLTSPFGPRPGGFHPGIDIGSLQSLTVRAAIGGRVVTVGEQAGYDGYGNVVVVAIGGGFTTMYAHLARPLVGAGDDVLTGEVVGIAGCTGWCTGTHVHFELRDRGTPMDPLTLFPSRIPAVAPW
jgi:murein DD-endopeptidase MepM/ murein hydrolase activator NlpD